MKERDLRDILHQLEVPVVHKNHRGWLVASDFLACCFARLRYPAGMQFKTIPQNPQFEISEDGSIVRRRLPGWGTRVGKILSIRQNDGAYLRVKLMDRLYQVHALVCSAFHGLPPEGKPFALHRNDHPRDNRAENLYWGSRADNWDDARKNGRLKVHERHPRAKLTWPEVHAIRASEGTASERALAQEFGISRATINQILRRTIWNETK